MAVTSSAGPRPGVGLWGAAGGGTWPGGPPAPRVQDWARPTRTRRSHSNAGVALARKLAVIMHRMLATGEPFRWPQIEAAATA